jgi:hypothetical protein
MKPLCKSAILTAILAAVAMAAFVPQASAQTPPPGQPVLLGTTGSCRNVNQGGPCTETSTLVEIDPSNGALVRVIGPVGYTVNGMAWDPATDKLYATTAIGDVAFHGLITIDPNTGQGTPVNPLLHNFGLAGADSPIHSVTIDSKGNRMVAWYDEFPPPQGVTDTFVTIDKTTGVATEFDNTGINTSQNGLAFDKKDLLWNIDSPKFQPDGSITQTAYQLDPTNGQPVHEQLLTPPIPAALGDFDPEHKIYYGLNFEVFNPQTALVTVDLKRGTVAVVGSTVDNLHTLAFVRHLP